MSAPVAPQGTYLSPAGRPLSRVNAAIRAMAVGSSLFVPGRTSAQIGGALFPVGAYTSKKTVQDGVTGVLVTRLHDHAILARIRAAGPELLGLVVKAAEQFEFYAEQHAAKGTPEADAKAKVNRDLAAEMRAGTFAALGQAPS